MTIRFWGVSGIFTGISSAFCVWSNLVFYDILKTQILALMFDGFENKCQAENHRIQINRLISATINSLSAVLQLFFLIFG